MKKNEAKEKKTTHKNETLAGIVKHIGMRQLNTERTLLVNEGMKGETVFMLRLCSLLQVLTSISPKEREKK